MSQSEVFVNGAEPSRTYTIRIIGIVLCYFALAIGLLTGNLIGVLLGLFYLAAAVGMHRRMAWGPLLALILSVMLGFAEVGLLIVKIADISTSLTEFSVGSTVIRHFLRLLLHGAIVACCVYLRSVSAKRVATPYERAGTA